MRLHTQEEPMQMVDILAAQTVPNGDSNTENTTIIQVAAIKKAVEVVKVAEVAKVVEAITV